MWRDGGPQTRRKHPQGSQPASAPPQGGTAWDSLGRSLALGGLGAPSIALGREPLPPDLSWTRLRSLCQLPQQPDPRAASACPSSLPSRTGTSGGWGGSHSKLGSGPGEALHFPQWDPGLHPGRGEGCQLLACLSTFSLRRRVGGCCSRCGWYGPREDAGQEALGGCVLRLCPRGGAQLEGLRAWEPFVRPSLGVASPPATVTHKASPRVRCQYILWALEGPGHEGH